MMKDSSEKVTYTTFNPNAIISVLYGISFIFLIAFNVLILYVFIFMLPSEITLEIGRIALVAGAVLVGLFLLILILYNGWVCFSYSGLFKTNYIFDTEGIHAKGLFKRQFMPWSQVKDFGFSYVMNEYEYEYSSRYYHSKWFVKTGRIYKVYFSDTVCKSLSNGKKELKGKRINFYISFPLTTPFIDFQGMTWIRSFIDYAEEKTGIKANIPGYVHPFLYPEQIYNTTE